MAAPETVDLWQSGTRVVWAVPSETGVMRPSHTPAGSPISHVASNPGSAVDEAEYEYVYEDVPTVSNELVSYRTAALPSAMTLATFEAQLSGRYGEQREAIYSSMKSRLATLGPNAVVPEDRAAFILRAGPNVLPEGGEAMVAMLKSLPGKVRGNTLASLMMEAVGDRDSGRLERLRVMVSEAFPREATDVFRSVRARALLPILKVWAALDRAGESLSKVFDALNELPDWTLVFRVPITFAIAFPLLMPLMLGLLPLAAAVVALRQNETLDKKFGEWQKVFFLPQRSVEMLASLNSASAE